MAAPVVESVGAWGQTATITAPSSVAADDLVVIAVWADGARTPPSGFTEKLLLTHPSYGRAYIWWKRSTGSEPSSYTASASVTGQAYRISGAATSGDPFVASDTANPTGGSTATGNTSLASIPADHLLFWHASHYNAGNLTALPSGFTEVSYTGVSGSAASHVAVKAHTAAGNTGTISGTWNASNIYRLAILLAIAPAVTAIPGTIAATLPAFTASLTGTQNPGSISATLPAFTADLAGYVASDRLDAVLPAFTADLAGQQNPGNIAATLPAFTADIDVDLSVPGTLDATLKAFTADLSGGVQSIGQIDATLPAFTADLNGDVPEPPTWTEVVRSAIYLTTAQSALRGTDVRVEMIDDNETVAATLPVIGGNVSWNSTQTEQWGASVTIGESDYMPNDVHDLLHPLSGLRARIWWTLDLPTGLVAQVPIGTYYPSKPSASRGKDFALTVTLRDVISRIRRNKWAPGDLLDLGGVTVSEALARILTDRGPRYTVRINPTTEVLPDIYEVGQVGRDPTEDMKSIANAAVYRIGSDRMGAIVAGPRTATDAPTRLDLSEGDDCRVEQIRRDLDESELLNRLTVRSTAPEIDPPVYATVDDTDPASPLWVGRGFVYSDTIDSDSVTTEAQCRALAATTLAERRALIESVDMVHRARPELDLGDIIAVNESKTGARGLYEVAAWSLDLAPGSMQRTVLVDRRVAV